MLSMVSFGGNSSLGLAPFALAIVAATLSNCIPIGFVYIVSCIGTFIGFGTSGLINYIITSLVFFISLFVFKTRIQDDCNERRKVGKNIITGTVFPFETYVKNVLPNTKPIITPGFPNLLNKPAIKPDIAYAPIIIGSPASIIPSTIPVVIPPVAPTNIPFFHPNIKTINMHKIFFKENPKICIGVNAENAIAIIMQAPITSSIEKTCLNP